MSATFYKEKILWILFPFCIGLIFAFVKAIFTHLSQISEIKNFFKNVSSGLVSSFESLDISYIPEENAFAYFTRYKWLYATKCNIYIYKEHLVVLVYRKFPIKLYAGAFLILVNEKNRESTNIYFPTFTVKKIKENALYKSRMSFSLKSSASYDADIHFNNISQELKNTFRDYLGNDLTTEVVSR